MAAPAVEAPQGAPPPPGGAREAETPEEEEELRRAWLGRPPRAVWGARAEFGSRPHNFLRGCCWAPDGSCVLSCSDDNVLRLFDLPSPHGPPAGPPLPELVPALRVPEGDTIYDFAWFPLMDSGRPETCLLACSSRDSPVHLWDAFDGALRGSFRACTHLEEPAPPHSLAFTPDGARLLGGGAGALRLFPLPRPGSHGLLRRLPQRGLIGCLAVSPTQPLVACGSYGRSLGLYDVDGEGGALALWPRLPAAPTHLRFSPDGTRLYAGGRKDRHILCWDLRRPERPLLALERGVGTNQRVTFDLDPSGRFVVGGDTRGFLSVWDALAPPGPGDPPVLPPLLRFRALRDCLNGTSLHPWLPLVATASGQRLFPAPWDSEDEEGDGDGPPPGGDNRLQLWWWGPDPPGDGDGHPPGDTGTADGDCHSPENIACHPPGDTATMDTDCHPPGDTGTPYDTCHPPGDTATGDTATMDTATMDTDCHPPGDTATAYDGCHPPGDTGMGNGDCHPPGDTATMDTNCHPPWGHRDRGHRL